MTLTAFLDPVHAAGAVHLGTPLVLNDVPCPACRPHDTYSLLRIAACKSCRGSGTVAPSVEPGQRINLAAVGDLPDSWRSEHWRLLWRGAATNEAILNDGAGREIPLHTRKVVGSVTATTPALPIVDDPDFVPDEHGALMIDREVDENGWGLVFFKSTGVEKRLGEWLPWLGDDLVGRWAVLTAYPSPTLEGHLHRFPQERYVESRLITFCPAPLPDGVDRPAGTLIDLDLAAWQREDR